MAPSLLLAESDGDNSLSRNPIYYNDGEGLAVERRDGSNRGKPMKRANLLLQVGHVGSSLGVDVVQVIADGDERKALKGTRRLAPKKEETKSKG